MVATLSPFRRRGIAAANELDARAGEIGCERATGDRSARHMVNRENLYQVVTADSGMVITCVA